MIDMNLVPAPGVGALAPDRPIMRRIAQQRPVGLPDGSPLRALIRKAKVVVGEELLLIIMYSQ
jgi:hypothetical protein